MRIELDHLFVCSAFRAPEGDKLVQFGLREGLPSEHLGQGTANRRFSFANAMIELIWVRDAEEAQSEPARRTRLWERWSARAGNASPFGICLRPVDGESAELPFPAWEYRPSYLPPPLSMHIDEAGIEEPMWVYMGFLRRRDRKQYFTEHPAGIREITRLTLVTPVPLCSGASRKAIEDGVLSTRSGTASLLEIEFDRRRGKKSVDFRPELPLVFRF